LLQSLLKNIQYLGKKLLYYQNHMLGFQQFHNKKIAILWYGREGKSSLNFLLHSGILPENITILDVTPQQLPDPKLHAIYGPSYIDSLADYDYIIKTPWISLYSPKIYPYKDKITSQAQIFFDCYQGKIIAISGTKGKSTTATLTYETLKAAGKSVQLIGNIGNPVLDYLNIQDLSKQQEEIVVFEISSYMLDGLKKHNYISVLLNIYADHLDWHEGFENYKNAKLNILSGSEHLLIRDEITQKYPDIQKNIAGQSSHVFWHQGKYSYGGGVFFIDGKKIFDEKDILLKGEHNRINICAVLGICDILHIDPMLLKTVLKTFAGLPHRMQQLWIYGDIQWVDDAISTTPESTIQAIKTFENEIDTIFLGWTDRGYVFDELIQVIRESTIRNIVLFPDSGKRIGETIQKHNYTEHFTIYKTENMQDAVKFAYENTQKGKICLLSTASPSYSIWKNFEEKGNLFAQYIKTLV